MNVIVTKENIDDIKFDMPLDQAEELRPGCITWTVQDEMGNIGWMTVWPDTDRGAVCWGGNSCWGDWDEDRRVLVLDEFDENGQRIIINEDGEEIGNEALAKAKDLELAGVKPVAEYDAAAGPNYGFVMVWETEEGYLVYWGDKTNENAVYKENVDISNLASWIENSSLRGLEAIEQMANIRGADAVSEAKEYDKGPFYILMTRRWLGWGWHPATETSAFVEDNRGPLAFETLQDARAWIERADSEVYYLAHNEYERPSYKVVTT